MKVGRIVRERRKALGLTQEQVAEAFEGRIRIFESRIPSTVKVGESIYYCEPLLEYAPQAKVSKAYLDFGKELMGYEG